METFEPMSGVAILFVAEKNDRNSIKAFLLDKPVCLNKGIWHGIITLSQQAFVKVTENNTVDRLNYDLPFEMKIDLVME